MSSTIKDKLLDTALSRQTLQEQAKQKSGQVSRELRALTQFKNEIRQSKQTLHAMKNDEPAISHIQGSRLSDVDGGLVDAHGNEEMKESLYTKNGTLKPADTTKSSRRTPVDQRDDFYAVVDRGSTMHEDPRGYYIEAFAPDYEKDNIRVSITHGKAVISGSRKFQDKVEDRDKKISTSNFQTFSEEFKLSDAINADGITRERDGDRIRFFIPKLDVGLL